MTNRDKVTKSKPVNWAFVSTVHQVNCSIAVNLGKRISTNICLFSPDDQRDSQKRTGYFMFDLKVAKGYLNKYFLDVGGTCSTPILSLDFWLHFLGALKAFSAICPVYCQLLRPWWDWVGSKGTSPFKRVKGATLNPATALSVIALCDQWDGYDSETTSSWMQHQL